MDRTAEAAALQHAHHVVARRVRALARADEGDRARGEQRCERVLVHGVGM